MVEERRKSLRICLAKIRYKTKVNEFTKKLALLDIVPTPEMLGVLVWPYIHNEWDISTKLNTIAQHYQILSCADSNVADLNTSSPTKIIDFGQISEGVTVVIDRPPWFMREGELVINIFRDNLRVASMAFCLAYMKNEIIAYVGAIQGIHNGVDSTESLGIYKKLTKDFYGLRPKSLLLEALKVLLKRLKVTRILGISEQNRHHRHEYFGKDKQVELKSEYNLFWEEHGALSTDSTGFYEMSLAPSVKELTLIASKKRSQYRKRYAFIESFSNLIVLD